VFKGDFRCKNVIDFHDRLIKNAAHKGDRYRRQRSRSSRAQINDLAGVKEEPD
jgi:hypothetical protein